MTRKKTIAWSDLGTDLRTRAEAANGMADTREAVRAVLALSHECSRALRTKKITVDEANALATLCGRIVTRWNREITKRKRGET